MQSGLMDISIAYCAPCGYAPRVISLTQEIIGTRDLEAYIRSWTLTPSSGGVFEVTINGELVFSKKALGRHAEDGEIKTIITQKLESLRAGADLINP